MKIYPLKKNHLKNLLIPRYSMVLGYPLFLMILERSLRDLKFGETVEFMGVTLTAAAVAFLIPVMFPGTGIRAITEKIIDKFINREYDEELVLDRIRVADNSQLLSQYATLFFALSVPAWIACVMWSITPDVIYWFGLPSSLVVGALYFPAAAVSIANDSLKI